MAFEAAFSLSSSTLRPNETSARELITPTSNATMTSSVSVNPAEFWWELVFESLKIFFRVSES